MKPITAHIWLFTGLIAGRAHLIDDADGLTIVDASLPGAGRKIVRQLEQSGRKAGDVKHILITHAHPDHVGGLPELQRLTGAEVICHELEKPVVEGSAPIIRPPTGPLANSKQIMPGTPVTRTVADGEMIGGWQAVFTPGHAPGHLAFWSAATGVLLAGDVLFNVFGLTLPPAMLTVDMDEDRRSVAKLAALEPSIICFGHGPALKDDAAGRLKAFAEKIGVG